MPPEGLTLRNQQKAVKNFQDSKKEQRTFGIVQFDSESFHSFASFNSNSRKICDIFSLMTSFERTKAINWS